MSKGLVSRLFQELKLAHQSDDSIGDIAADECVPGHLLPLLRERVTSDERTKKHVNDTL